MALLYTLNEIKQVKPKNGTDFTLEELQEYVEGHGHIELVWLQDDTILVCNEEGLLEKRPLNPCALEHAQKLGYKPNYLVGNVLFANDNEIK